MMKSVVAPYCEENSKNSSKPSSQTEKDQSSTRPGTNGKGKEESSDVATNTRTVETTTIAAVTLCPVCGNDLTNAACEHTERRTKINIVFEKVVEHVDAEVKYCDQCETTVKGKFPNDMPSTLQYGNGIKAYIINLLVCQMISPNRVQKLVKTLIGRSISEATMLQFILRLHEILEAWELEATQ